MNNHTTTDAVTDYDELEARLTDPDAEVASAGQVETGAAAAAMHATRDALARASLCVAAESWTRWP